MRVSRTLQIQKWLKSCKHLDSVTTFHLIQIFQNKHKPDQMSVITNKHLSLKFITYQITKKKHLPVQMVEINENQRR